MIPLDPLRRRCVKLAKKGEYRKAAVALRELVVRDDDPASWVRLGVMLIRARRIEQGLDALKQGQWLHQRAGKRARADVVARIIARVRQGDQVAA